MICQSSQLPTVCTSKEDHETQSIPYRKSAPVETLGLFGIPHPVMPVSHYRGSPADPPADPLRIPCGSPQDLPGVRAYTLGILRGSPGDPQGIWST